MYRIYLDTSNSLLTLVITRNNMILISHSEFAQQKQSDIAILTIKNLLKKNNLELCDINEIVVTIGPGSYTGVRVAITFAKTLKALNNKINIFMINSLLLQAGLKNVISIISSHNNKSYIAAFKNTKEIIPIQLVNENAKLGIISDLKNFKFIENYQGVDIVTNFLDLSDSLIKVKDINDLKPLYIGSNF